MSPQGVALGYEPPAGRGEGRVWVPQGGSHRAAGLSDAQRKRLVGAVLELRTEPGAKLVLLGVAVDGLAGAAREALRERVGFLPVDGGLISNLNAWENMVLPVAFHHPDRMRAVAESVNQLVRSLGGDTHGLLAKLPERMTPYEKKLAGYVRIMLERPDLVVSEESQSGLGPEERKAVARFPEVYLESRPGGTFVQLEVATAH